MKYNLVYDVCIKIVSRCYRLKLKNELKMSRCYLKKKLISILEYHPLSHLYFTINIF